MKTVCQTDMCAGCFACISVCPKRAIHLEDSLKAQNAFIQEDKCIHCGLCEKVCQVNNPLKLKKPMIWCQGWSSDPDIRAASSSGAFAYMMAKQIVEEGGYIVSCRFENGAFRYHIAHSFLELHQFQGSKYVKSNPGNIYSEVASLLKQGETVLLIGLPCHIAAFKRFAKEDYDSLITVDLICHGSPSPKLLDLFLNQYNITLQEIESIVFRQKDNFRLKVSVKCSKMVSFTEPGIKDKYTYAFLHGLTYTENCYRCPYAGLKRVSDITLGDSWGSDIDMDNQKKGISLALCQTEKGKSLLDRCDIEKFPVDIEKAIAANHQLREPFPIPSQREVFFGSIENGFSFNNAVRRCFRKACFRLDIKNSLIKAGIIRSRGSD